MFSPEDGHRPGCWVGPVRGFVGELVPCPGERTVLLQPFAGNGPAGRWLRGRTFRGRSSTHQKEARLALESQSGTQGT